MRPEVSFDAGVPMTNVMGTPARATLLLEMLMRREDVELFN